MANNNEKKSIVFLAGFMGSGKSTIGPILANTLGYEFIDLDALIEASEHKKIEKIFSDKGEAYFRAVERTLLTELLERAHIVVSLGGGTIVHQPTLDAVKQHGILIYLKADAVQIYRRLRPKGDRPLLRTPEGVLMDDEQLKARIAELLAQRSAYYEQAHFIMQTDDKKIGLTIDTIVQKLRGSLEE
ncbi:MAG: shikimate kinase [Bacteroidota bacterium]|nr:shikimate kinase [Bacteroidota bacterium]